mmetsp:Transcript_62359/g.190621  ORF Transcript_62359/g.190621 Transcript_62359/m.190621 type:complete len:256 (-) Transcript_62359:2212-2979(-)
MASMEALRIRLFLFGAGGPDPGVDSNAGWEGRSWPDGKGPMVSSSSEPSPSSSSSQLPRLLRARLAASDCFLDPRRELQAEHTKDWKACVFSHWVAAGVMHVWITKPVSGSVWQWHCLKAPLTAEKNGSTTSASTLSKSSWMVSKRSSSTFAFKMSWSMFVDMTIDLRLTSTSSDFSSELAGSAYKPAALAPSLLKTPRTLGRRLSSLPAGCLSSFCGGLNFGAGGCRRTLWGGTKPVLLEAFSDSSSSSSVSAE